MQAGSANNNSTTTFVSSASTTRLIHQLTSVNTRASIPAAVNFDQDDLPCGTRKWWSELFKSFFVGEVLTRSSTTPVCGVFFFVLFFRRVCAEKILAVTFCKLAAPFLAEFTVRIARGEKFFALEMRHAAPKWLKPSLFFVGSSCQRQKQVAAGCGYFFRFCFAFIHDERETESGTVVQQPVF